MKNTKALSSIFLIIFIFVSNLFFNTSRLYANGGPGESYNIVYGSNIEFMKVPDIFVDEEILTVKLETRSVEVTAEYHLRNTGEARELQYFFPINVIESYDYDALTNAQWVRFSDNGNNLPYTMETKGQEIIQEGSSKWYDELFKAIDYSFPYDSGYMTSCVYKTNLSFKEGETKVLTVKYRTDAPFSSWATTKTLFTLFSDYRFIYDLRPAAAWGDGKAAKFTFNFDYSALKDVKEFNLNIGKFKFNDKMVYTYAENNFEFNKQKAITATFDNPRLFWEVLDENWRNNCIDKLYVSSNSDSSDPKNLVDTNLNTVWTSKSEKDICIEFKISKENYTDGGMLFGILNGNITSEDFYYDYSRIKKASIEFRRRCDGNIYSLESESSGIYEFEDIPYSKIDKALPFAAIAFSDAFHAEEGTEVYARIRVLETYPGRKYKSISIAELFAFLYDDREKNLVISKDSFFPDLTPIATKVTEPVEDTYPEYVEPTEEPTAPPATITPTATPAKTTGNIPARTAPLEDNETEEPGSNLVVIIIITFVTTLALSATGTILFIKYRKKKS